MLFSRFKASIVAKCEELKSNRDDFEVIQTLANIVNRIRNIAVEVKFPK